MKTSVFRKTINSEEQLLIGKKAKETLKTLMKVHYEISLSY